MIPVEGNTGLLASTAVPVDSEWKERFYSVLFLLGFQHYFCQSVTVSYANCYPGDLPRANAFFSAPDSVTT